MAILLVTWGCLSMAFCLALLGAAARPVPCPDEKVAPGCDILAEQIRTTVPTPQSVTPANCQAA
ncbi:MAG TPA: hypothetical protein P5205_06625 [Candidatus Paceibacterota bacterium]|nr:hypothetical protein [Verrucomicrobiota bacterium]HSA10030.1 hypothetical protein [Candidatus Paceibacterota bacterium]